MATKLDPKLYAFHTTCSHWGVAVAWSLHMQPHMGFAWALRASHSPTLGLTNTGYAAYKFSADEV